MMAKIKMISSSPMNITTAIIITTSVNLFTPSTATDHSVVQLLDIVLPLTCLYFCVYLCLTWINIRSHFVNSSSSGPTDVGSDGSGPTAVGGGVSGPITMGGRGGDLTGVGSGGSDPTAMNVERYPPT